MGSGRLEVCIVGAGMSGILMGIRLKQAGIESFRILEKASSLGGTWRDNRYPGLTCDVPSRFYSYSFAPNLDWTHRFSPGPEILAYFERVAGEYGIPLFITFDARVTSARYAGDRWIVETNGGAAAGGETIDADVVVKATGALHTWHMPKIDGLEQFEGGLWHSADWDDDFELTGKRIGVVGNGSTGVQMMDPLSRVADRLTLFQRTPQWVVPMGNRPYSEKARKRVRRFPILARLERAWFQLLFEAASKGVVKPGRMRDSVGKQVRQALEQVADPELRRKLTPDYEPMCKRLIMSRTFYPAVMRDNVEVVTDGIDHVEARGVVTRDGRLHEVDALVLATGFDTHAWGVDEIVGARGQTVKEAWAQGTRAYRSIALPGFPNLFMMVGPNSPIGNISVIDVAEVQADYIMRCLERLREGRATAMAPTPDATAAFHAQVLEAMKDTVWVTGCNSWYLDEAGVPNTWPWTAKRFHKDMRRPKFADFEFSGG